MSNKLCLDLNSWPAQFTLAKVFFLFLLFNRFCCIICNISNLSNLSAQLIWVERQSEIWIWQLKQGLKHVRTVSFLDPYTWFFQFMSKQNILLRLIFTFTTSQMFFELYLSEYCYHFQASDANLWNCVMWVKLYYLTSTIYFYLAGYLCVSCLSFTVFNW